MTIPFLALLLYFSPVPGLAQQMEKGPDLKLWYDKPASAWEEALPLGNGKTGAMVFGNPYRERFQLNDNTLWSGYPQPGNNPDGVKYLPLLRKAVDEGDYGLAANYWKKMQGPYSARYLHMANLFIDLLLNDAPVTNYNRTLNLNNAIATVSYKSKGTTFTREVFVSNPDKVMVVRLTSNRKKSINLSAWLDSKLRHTSTVSDDQIVLNGKAPMYVANRESEPLQVVYDMRKDGEGMTFQVHLKIKVEGGTITKTDSSLNVIKADAVTIYLTEDTSFNGYKKSPGSEGKDPAVEADKNLQNALSKNYEQLKENHVRDYQNLFNRVELHLGADKEALDLPTDQRLLRFNQGKGDNYLQTLYY